MGRMARPVQVGEPETPIPVSRIGLEPGGCRSGPMSISPHRTGTVRVLLAGVAATLVALLGAASLAAITPTAAAASSADDEAALFNLHNQHRITSGLAPLQNDTAAAGVARSWAQHLAATGVLGHNPNLVWDV